MNPPGQIHTAKVYLDCNASTPIAPEVGDAMRPFLVNDFGNPSSQHWASERAKEAVENARMQVARLLGCDLTEVVFTSGGSESNNHAIKGVFYANQSRGNHIITTQVEHPAVINPCRFLEKLGARATYLPVDRFGRVDPQHVRRALTPQTILVSVMHANNEVGTVQPIREISEIVRSHGILFHTDAAQSVGKIPVNVDDLGVDLLSVAGHKVYGPKGVGALYVRKGTQIEPLIHGAGHEGGRRAGTENVLLIVGLGRACELAENWVGMGSVRSLRDLFWSRIQEMFGAGVVLNGHPTERLPNTLNVGFAGRVGAEILAGLTGVAASTGSACHEGSVELSPVLKAMGLDPRVGMGAIRFSLGRDTTEEEIDYVASLLEKKKTPSAVF
ncbi:MAG: cysteine desulfurase [Deltaproteobacteria bacterium]|nr:cysteine desulfurase [Deltaproteobacteria bacterium]MBW2122094.1 cysteine desulfurase [Deltaproteobacteria bacterium]